MGVGIGIVIMLFIIFITASVVFRHAKRGQKTAEDTVALDEICTGYAYARF